MSETAQKEFPQQLTQSHVSAPGRFPDQVVVVLDVLPPDYVRQFVSRSEGGTVVLPDGTVKIVVQPHCHRRRTWTSSR